jgi:Na+/proline symporter
MSDIGILNDPLSIAFVTLLLGSPGLPLGAIGGALVWRRHRVVGAVVGALVGFVVWLAGWMWLNDVI